jgi:hypothetical protein
MGETVIAVKKKSSSPKGAEEQEEPINDTRTLRTGF